MTETNEHSGFKAAQMALVIPDKKTKYQKFVKYLFDNEALRAEQLRDDKTFLSVAPLQESNAINEKEKFLEGSLINSNRVIRKIDKINDQVENGVRDLIFSISNSRKAQLFYIG